MSEDDPITIEEIQTLAAQYFFIDRADILGRNQEIRFTRPRQIAMWIAREISGCSLTKIGALFGNRDHSTVIHSIRTITEMVAKDVGIRILVDELHQQIIREHARGTKANVGPSSNRPADQDVERRIILHQDRGGPE